jgi:hypothetical protein
MEPRLARKENSVEQHARRKAAKGSSVMVARIIELAVYRAQRTLAQQELAERPVRANNESTRFHFWTGASGKRYVHSVYDLMDCPPLPAANYVLVRRKANGRAEALSIARVSNDAPSLNLAEIRQRAAELGAEEVHVHLLADNAKLSKLIEFDLRTGQVEADVASIAGGRAS